MALTTALGETGMTAANSVVQMMATTGHVLTEGTECKQSCNLKEITIRKNSRNYTVLPNKMSRDDGYADCSSKLMLPNGLGFM